MHHCFDVTFLLWKWNEILSSSCAESCLVSSDFLSHQLSAVFLIPTTCYSALGHIRDRHIKRLVSDSRHKKSMAVDISFHMGGGLFCSFSKDFRD